MDPTQLLRLRFLQRLLDQRPASVLDVGCGTGEILERLGEAGVPAEGVERNASRAADLLARGLAVAEARAEALPFDDGAFDWVAIRHVAHHMDDVGAALVEAARVARTGLVVAEPWRDVALPQQALAARYDRWLKRQDRRRGHPHHDDLRPLEIAARLPEPESWELEVDYFQRPGTRDLGEVRREAEELLAELAPDDPERAEGAGLLEEAERVGIGATGTATLVARKRAAVGLAEPLVNGSGETLGRVRLARADDVPAIVGMLADDALGAARESAEQPLPVAYARAFERVAASPAQELVVAEREGAVIATLQLTYLPGLSRRGATRAQIEAVRVAAEGRGSGLGGALIAWAVDRARARGCALVQLTSDKTRDRAHAFYERLGFRATHEGMKIVFSDE